MSGSKRARCPLCERITGTFTHNGRRIYNHHYAEGRTNAAMVCDASGWLVEDDELVTVPRKPNPLKGIAQPSRADRVPTPPSPDTQETRNA